MRQYALEKERRSRGHVTFLTAICCAKYLPRELVRMIAGSPWRDWTSATAGNQTQGLARDAHGKGGGTGEAQRGHCSTREAWVWLPLECHEK